MANEEELRGGAPLGEVPEYGPFLPKAGDKFTIRYRNGDRSYDDAIFESRGAADGFVAAAMVWRRIDPPKKPFLFSSEDVVFRPAKDIYDILHGAGDST